MIKEVNAKNQPCPKPVIMTKKALEEAGVEIVKTEVDNEVAKENVLKLAKSMGFETKVTEVEENFVVEIHKGEVVEIEDNKNNELQDVTVIINSETMGNGAEELGKILIKGFVYTLTETAPYPKTIVLYNSGAKLTCEGAPTVDDFKKLEEAGVEIITCGTCLDYYNLKDKLKVGSIGNMYTIVEKIKNANNSFSI